MVIRGAQAGPTRQRIEGFSASWHQRSGFRNLSHFALRFHALERFTRREVQQRKRRGTEAPRLVLLFGISSALWGWRQGRKT
jgi:hypothetical protein